MNRDHLPPPASLFLHIHLFKWFDTSIGIAKLTLDIVYRIEGVYAPSTNVFPATWIIDISKLTPARSWFAICKVVNRHRSCCRGGSDIHDNYFIGIGRKQIGQSSFGGGSLTRASSRGSAARIFAISFMRCPMIHLACGVAIPDEHKRLTRLETNASLLAALGTSAAGVSCMVVLLPVTVVGEGERNNDDCSRPERMNRPKRWQPIIGWPGVSSSIHEQ